MKPISFMTEHNQLKNINSIFILVQCRFPQQMFSKFTTGIRELDYDLWSFLQ